MPRENADAKRERAARIFERLRRAYPDAHCELDHASPLQLLVATILSAQCTDKAVNRVTPSLFAKYRTAAEFAAAPAAELEEAIHSLGFFRNKAKSIQNCCRQLVEQHGGEVPATMEALTQLAGVGRKTANVVLGNAFNIQEGFVVDTHVRRLSQRMAFTAHDDPEKIELDLIQLLPRPEWCLDSHLLIWHGRRRCFARSPDCPACEVLSECPTGQKNISQAEKPAAPKRGKEAR